MSLAYTNVMLIDSSVPDAQLFVSSVNSNTLPIMYSRSTTKTDIRDQLKEFTTIQRIGIVFVNAGPPQMFLDNESFTTNDNTSFMTSLVQDFHVERVDYLGCNTLKDDEWVNYYNTLTTTGLIVGASNDNTGNLKYGGDWVMESTGENIELIYFTENIEYYKYLLDINFSTFIVKTTGQMYGTGSNSNGELGIGFIGFQKADIPLNVTIDKIAHGNRYTFILSTTGQVYGTGMNNVKQLGISGTINEFTLIPITDNPNITTIACGDSHSIALDISGQLYGTGRNIEKQLGISGTINEFTPIPITDNPIITTIACGDYHSIVLDNNGQLYGTGLNDDGQLGINGTITEFTPIPITGNPFIVAIACGEYHSIALDISGQMYGTGLNDDGQLGISGTITEFTPIPITGNPFIVAIACGASHSIALDISGQMYGTGLNDDGQLGIIGTINEFTPIPITGNPNVTSIACGEYHSIALDNNGHLYGTGYNNKGQLGISGTITEFTQIPITGNPTITAFACRYRYTIALDNNGNLYGYGQLGISTQFDFHYGFKPINVNDTYISLIMSSNGYSLVFYENGNLYGTGLNDEGQLGIIGTITEFTPIPITGNPAIIAIACGASHSIVLDNNGQLYGTGRNDDGQLGINGTITEFTPIPITGNPFIVEIACGVYHSIALDISGQMYGTGINDQGQLGIIGTITEFTPIPITGNPTIVAISCGTNSIALDNNGQLYGSGNNYYGELGISGTFTEFTPIPITGNPTIVAISCGYRHSIALDNNGQLYGTGRNNVGQLGFNSGTITEFTPIPITGNPTIISIVCGYDNSIALDDNNNLYGTGRNSEGQLGIIGTVTEFTLIESNVQYVSGMPRMISAPVISSVIPIANICFPAGTPIQTDQGIFSIETLHPNVHTIYNRRIIDITKTVSPDSYLVQFQKHALGHNYPSANTVMSSKHKVYYNGAMREARTLIGPRVHKVKYSGEILYNVLQERHATMFVNNLICETLNPQNIIAKLFTNQCKHTKTERNTIVHTLKESLEKKEYTKYNNLIQSI